MLQGRNYVLVVDKSGSMSTSDVNGKSRWSVAQEGTRALAAKVQEFDPDGIDVYTFATSFKYYPNTTAEKIDQIWKENEPNGSTALDLVLNDAFAKHFERKAAGNLGEGTTIVVVTDGEPNDRKAAAKAIVDASNKLDKDEELAVAFIQIGKDGGATTYLKSLDDDLQGQGAKYDIVDATTQEEAEGMTFTELLTKAISD